MQNHQQSDRLSWGDTVFLHLEREGMPLNVASVCIFEGEVEFEEFVEFVETKLPLLPRYLKRVVPAPVRARSAQLGIRPRIRSPPSRA